MKTEKIKLYSNSEIKEAQKEIPNIMFYPNQSIGTYHGISIHPSNTIVKAHRSILAICARLTTNEYVIIVDDYFLQAPEQVRTFILSHELGHITDLNEGKIQEVPLNQIDISMFKRMGGLLINKVDSKELSADEFAVGLTSKQDGIDSLNYIINTFNLSSRELKLRINHIQNLK